MMTVILPSLKSLLGTQGTLETPQRLDLEEAHERAWTMPIKLLLPLRGVIAPMRKRPLQSILSLTNPMSQAAHRSSCPLGKPRPSSPQGPSLQISNPREKWPLCSKPRRKQALDAFKWFLPGDSIQKGRCNLLRGLCEPSPLVVD